MIREIKGKKYKLSSSKELKVGDMYWTAFTNNVEIYKDVDYGIFDPKTKDYFYKVEFVDES